MTDDRVPQHLQEVLERSARGGVERVLAVLAADERLEYAGEGVLEESSSQPGGGGRRQAGLLLLTDRRILLVGEPGRFPSKPRVVSIPYRSVRNAGVHKSDPQVVVVRHDDPVTPGHYLILPDTGDAGMTGRIWGTTIIEAAERARRRP